MNISLLISGNLTGFGRFYTSPAASELLGNEKISLDNHSHLTFLGNNEKAYSITFAKRYIALSQYTQILDSFRRPGKLVVTLLLPRNYTVVDISGTEKGAAYSLLTKVSEKFFEKNFLDGMINQNPAVLGQDYYSEILNSYSLKPSDNRRINEDPSPVKKIGYVKSSEADIPNYLDTPYRKSYGEGGYNLIFFAPSAPAGTPNSIDEEPEEVVLYRVRILNTGAVLPNQVKLSSPIYKLQAGQGEKQFPIDGTYKDVIDHLKEPQITGRIMPNELIEVQFNFEKEEKTIKFVFVDVATSTPVNFDAVLPTIKFTDGRHYPLPSETFTFRGSEIYDEKKLVADSNVFSISPRSERLDLSRLSNNQEYKVYVQQGFNLPVSQMHLNLPISFVNKSTGQTQTFSNQKVIHLSGSVTDWNVFVDSDNYFAPVQALLVHNNGQWTINGLQQKKKIGTKKPDVPIRPSKSDIAVQTKTPTLPQVNLSGDSVEGTTSHTKKQNKVKWHKYLLLLPALLCVIGSGWWAYEKFNKPDQQLNGGDVESEENASEIWCYLIYYDNTEIVSKRDTIEVGGDEYSNKHYTHYNFSVLDENKEPLNSDDYLLKDDGLFENSKQYFRQKLTLSDNYNSKNCYIRVSYLCGEKYYQLVDEAISHENLTDHRTQSINLGLLLSQLNWYEEMSSPAFKFKDEREKNNKLKEISDLKDSEFSRELLRLANGKDYNREKPSPTPNPSPSPTPAEVKIPELLNGNSYLTADQLRANYKKDKVAKNIYNRAQAMAKALDDVNKLKTASEKGLSTVQQTTIKKYNNALKDDSQLRMLQGAKGRNQLSSFKQLWDMVEAW